MSLKQYFRHGVVAAACMVQVGCEVGGPPVDLRNPSVAELDAADIRWGLQPRKGKGASKRQFQYPLDESGGGGGGSAAAASAPVASAPAPTSTAAPQAPANPIPAAPDPQIDVNKLR